MKIYLINLDRSPDRLRFMDEQFNKLNLPYERISAVDGKSLNWDNLENFADPSRVEEWKDLLTPNAIACSLSHYQVYKKMVAEDIEMALILEDDIELDNKFPFLLKEIEKNGLNDTDVFLTYFHGDRKMFSDYNKIEISGEYKFFPAKTVWGAYSAGGYIIKSAVAKKMVDFLFPIKFTADSWGVFHREGVIGGLWALLPLVTGAANFGSDIGYTKVSRFLRSIEKNRFLPLYRFTSFLKKKMRDTSSSYEIIPDKPEWL